MVDKNHRVFDWSTNLSETGPELRNPTQESLRNAPIRVAGAKA
jgi:hypothetical protein